VTTTTQRPRAHPGRRSLRAGVALMVVAAVAIGGSIVAWLALSGPSADGAVVFEMPGTVTADLDAGDWALYSREVDGSQKVAYGSQVSIDGPGEVTTEETFGFYSDATTIEVDGTTYHVFLRLDVPADGRYRITVADGSTDPGTPVVVGRYDRDETLGLVVVVGILAGALLGAAGMVTAIVGLVLRSAGRRRAAA
jgi:hypothetical protein